MASVRQLKAASKRTGKRPWVVEYTDSKGERKRATPKSGLKRDAETLRLKIEVELEQGVHIAPVDALTVKALAERYMRYIEDKRRDGRVGRTYYDQQRNGIDKSVLPHVGHLKVTELDTNVIENWYRRMVGDDGLAPTTAKTRVYLLRTLETFANRRGLMRKTPVKDAAVEFSGIKAKPIRTMTAEQVAALLSAVATPTWGDGRQAALLACYVHLAVFCGLRYGEIGGLTRSSVNFERRTLEVRHNLTHYDEHKPPKTPAGVRDIPLPDHLAALLAGWMQEYFVANDRDLVFRIGSGAPLSPGNFHNRMWKPLLRRIGIQGPDWPHFHSLRHFAASWMLENRLSVTEVAALMGHSHFDITLQVYAHTVASGSQRREALDRTSSSLLKLAQIEHHAT